MLARTLLPTFRSLRRPGQSATRTHFTATWQAKPSSGILQMFSPSHRLNATHRGWTSGGRSPFNAPRPPRFGFWQQISQRINRLPSDLIFWGIFGINGVVFVLWQIANTQWRQSQDPTLMKFMFSHFTSSGWNLNNGRIWTLITSSFSQKDFGHLLFNGFTYYFTVPSILFALGNTGFLALYLGAGLVASVSSIWWHTNVQKEQKFSSLGASGALYGVLSFFACLAPRATFFIFGVIPCPAWLCVSGVFIYDGLSTFSGNRPGTDTAGHIGGILGGIGYYILRMRLRI